MEHVIPKVLYPAARHLWLNYLLGCNNCNGIKKDFDTVTRDCLFPDVHNTAWAFLYGPGALINVNPALGPTEMPIAQNTINMTGLDRSPVRDTRMRDRRWMLRDSAWRKAEGALQDFINGHDTPKLRERTIQLAYATGFFSVWWTVLGKDTDAVRRAELRNSLINIFQGTRRRCFDADGNVIADLRL